ncbi:MAG: TIGR04211 family SH3 domain-containing protein [Gammaproteobacteria bacterium]|jgi:SH3 domain protein|nr:TIGR04211 family SH3 domain-containing protein [Gammaproteobacteria bacterium]
MLSRLTFVRVFPINLLICCFLVSSALLAVSQFSFADEVYIRDMIYVPLRGGESTKHKIIHRGIRSGTPLERLQTNEQTGYTRVRTADGLEGWLQTQYLVDEPIASTQLDEVKSEMRSLDKQHQQTLLSLRETREAKESLTREQENLSDQNARLVEDLATITTLSGNVIAIDEKNKQLSEERDALRQQIIDLNELTDALSDDRAQQWFLGGAGVLLIGLLLGFWLGRRIYHKRYNGGWL